MSRREKLPPRSPIDARFLATDAFRITPGYRVMVQMPRSEQEGRRNARASSWASVTQSADRRQRSENRREGERARIPEPSRDCFGQLWRTKRNQPMDGVCLSDGSG